MSESSARINNLRQAVINAEQGVRTAGALMEEYVHGYHTAMAILRERQEALRMAIEIEAERPFVGK